MKTYKNLTIIGTSHISIESVKEVERTILKLKPKIVALELDRNRLHSLLQKGRKVRLRDIKELGIMGFIFNLIGAWVEKKLGEKVGSPPGSEMKKAIRCAYKVKAKIMLIDQDIKITIKKLSRDVTFMEKLRLVFDILKSFIIKDEELKNLDLRKVPTEKFIKKLIKKMKKRYPNFYKVLVAERNIIMAKKLLKIEEVWPEEKIVAVVGAGHESDILNLIKDAKGKVKSRVQFI